MSFIYLSVILQSFEVGSSIPRPCRGLLTGLACGVVQVGGQQLLDALCRLSAPAASGGTQMVQSVHSLY